MDNLLSHPGFRLIYVDQNDNMSLKTPLDGCKEDVLEKGYRCISHYWGPTPPKWEDHPVKGAHWGVHFREEKRARLLQIFNHHKGYWWVDVFCTNQDDYNKPLDVMGDIYRECTECVCMLDYIYGTDASISEKNVLTNVVKNVEKLLNGPIEACYTTMSGYGNWFNRVWTWQEAVLPPKLLFCREQDGGHEYDPFDHEYLLKLFPYEFMKGPGIHADSDYMVRELEKLDMNRRDVVFQLFPILYIISLGKERRDTRSNIIRLHESDRKCTNDEDYVYGITGVLNVSIPKGLTLKKATIELEKELRKQGIFVGYNRLGVPEGTGSLFTGGINPFKYKKWHALSPDENMLSGSSSEDDITNLGSLFEDKYVMDGAIVLGKIDASVYGFNSDIVLEYKNYGKVLGREMKDKMYIYKMETAYMRLKNIYNIGDTIETTMIGRKGCTFKFLRGSVEKESIYMIVRSGVKYVGRVLAEHE